MELRKNLKYPLLLSGHVDRYLKGSCKNYFLLLPSLVFKKKNTFNKLVLGQSWAGDNSVATTLPCL